MPPNNTLSYQVWRNGIKGSKAPCDVSVCVCTKLCLFVLKNAMRRQARISEWTWLVDLHPWTGYSCTIKLTVLEVSYHFQGFWPPVLVSDSPPSFPPHFIFSSFGVGKMLLRPHPFIPALGISNSLRILFCPEDASRPGILQLHTASRERPSAAAQENLLKPFSDLPGNWKTSSIFNLYQFWKDDGFHKLHNIMVDKFQTFGPIYR